MAFSRYITPTLCYAAVLAFVASCFTFPRMMTGIIYEPEMLPMSLLGMFLTLPAQGAVIGYGTGSLRNRRWRGVAAGFGIGLFVDVQIVAVIAFKEVVFG